MVGSWAAVVRPPPEFLADLAQELQQVVAGVGSISGKAADRMVGRAGRLAYLVPASRPFVLSLYAALSAGRAAGNTEDCNRPLPASRFAPAARWLLALIRPRPGLEEEFPLEHFVLHAAPRMALTTAAVVYFDASLWGGGAVLYRDRVAQEWLEVHWEDVDLSPLGLVVGRPSDQTAFEYLTLFLALSSWASSARSHGLAVLGDNVAALQCAISLKGRGPLNTLSREISWRRLRHSWWYAVGHARAEDNDVADALSRTAAPEGAERRSRPAGGRDLKRVRPGLARAAWETLLVD